MPSRRKKWYVATSVAHGVPLPAGRVHLASYGAGVLTPGAQPADVVFTTEPGLLVADPRRVRASLTAFAPGTPIPSGYRLIAETSGETD